ncbi:MAG: gamma-glutamylcyclotransferase family protein [Solidesulfovibrio sp.]
MPVTPAHFDVFAYGTLRQGFHNHHYVGESLFLGEATTCGQYAMYVAEGIPYLMAGEALYHIRGEVFRVDAAILAELDRLEEHPHVYCRQEADVVVKDGRRMRVQIYFARIRQGVLAATGDFSLLGV